MTPPSYTIPTDEELANFLVELKTDDRQHPYKTFPTLRQPSWRGGPALDDSSEQQYRDEQADYV